MIPNRKARRVNDARMVHLLVRKTAEGIAATMYEEMAHSNVFYSEHPSQKHYINQHWKNYVTAARGCLAEMLKMHDVSEHEKEEIYDALQLDSMLPYARQEIQLTGKLN